MIVEIVALVTLLGAATDKELARDKTRLQGAWTLVSVSVDGERNSEDPVSLKLVFAGDTVRVLLNGRNHNCTYRLDSSKTPKQMDLFASQSNGKQRAYPPWIYELSGEELRVGSGFSGPAPEVEILDRMPRPADFSAPGTANLVFRRSRE
jgi:uncharacterized protein (TIGR03067 family)